MSSSSSTTTSPGPTSCAWPGEEMQATGVTVPLWVSHRAAVVELGPLGRAWRTPNDPESPQALPPQ